jgi:nitroimidazol reductase NimA-like FMN-containing flavoprotein (pyridoxamine 5'-phosphate oxidase superfamily)
MGENQRASIGMSDDEITVFVEQQRSATIATVGPKGLPHLVAMWYAVIDGHVWIETKAKSQKVTNLRRNDLFSFLIEDGLTYDQLRGVSLEGRGVMVDDPTHCGRWASASSSATWAPTRRTCVHWSRR